MGLPGAGNRQFDMITSVRSLLEHSPGCSFKTSALGPVYVHVSPGRGGSVGWASPRDLKVARSMPVQDTCSTRGRA